MLDQNVLKQMKLKPWWWRYIPGLKGDLANTIYPHIYMNADMFNDLTSKHPSVRSQATMLHEAVHLKNQTEMGVFWYGFLYLVVRKFRFREELLAIHSQMQYLIKNKIDFDINQKARLLSSSTYLWASSYENALKELKILKKRLKD